MPTPSTLPPRFTETAFHRFEAVIRSAVSAFPQSFEIDARLYGLAPVTFACRFRDAMRSLADHNWPTTIDMNRFRDVWQQISVSEKATGNLVAIGSREHIRRNANSSNRPLPEAPIFITPMLSADTIQTTTYEQRLLLVTLAANRLLVQPIRCTGFTELECQEFQQSYDCSIQPNDDGTITLI